MMYTNNKFEWDHEKADKNFQKHGIKFENAAFAFEDPKGLVKDDEQHSLNEKREIFIGKYALWIIVIVFTKRADETVRIISARRANKKERAAYEEISFK